MTGNKNVSKNFTWALYPVKLLHVPLLTHHCVNMCPAQTKLVWETCFLIPWTWYTWHLAWHLAMKQTGRGDFSILFRRVGVTNYWINCYTTVTSFSITLSNLLCKSNAIQVFSVVTTWEKRYLKDQMLDAELSFQNIFEKHEFFAFNVSPEWIFFFVKKLCTNSFFP